MAEHLVTCSTVSTDAKGHRHVDSIGSGGQRWMVRKAIEAMQRKENPDTFVVSVGKDERVSVRVMADGIHITTNADDTPCNNLYNLPECP